MFWLLLNPKIGQRVRLHYAASKRRLFPYHGQEGVVVIASKGRPRNHMVLLKSGKRVVVPAGNLIKAEDG